MTENRNSGCRKGAWWAAIAGGVLVALMLLLIAQFTLVSALLIGVVVAVVLGVFLVWAFCPAEDASDQVEAATAPVSSVREVVADTPAASTGSASPAENGPETVAEPAAEPVKKPPAPKKPAASKPAAKKPAAKKAATAGTGKKPATASALDAALAKSKDTAPAGAPELLSAPRGGKADDLKMIKGVGPKLEDLLNAVGVWHFDQIAGWKAKDIAFVDEKMEGFKGRITRDEWVKQAKLLAKGGETEFSKRVTKGDVY